MQELDLFRIFIERLNKLNITYIITGAAASIIYGEPRMTHDLDMVIEIKEDEIENFAMMFPIDEFYCPPTEVIHVEMKRHQRGHFNLIHHDSGFKADIYLCGQDAMHRWALKNRRKISVENETYWLAPVEYVILKKLEYYREGESEKHLRDIAGILALSKELISFDFLNSKIDEKKLKTEWEKAKSYRA